MHNKSRAAPPSLFHLLLMHAALIMLLMKFSKILCSLIGTATSASQAWPKFIDLSNNFGGGIELMCDKNITSLSYLSQVIRSFSKLVTGFDTISVNSHGPNALLSI